MPFDAEIGQKSRDLIVLEKARDDIERNGWWSAYEDNRGGTSKCLWLAISYQFPHGVPLEVSARLKVALAFTETPWLSEIFDWNDAPGRTKAEVLARFDAAIERLSTLSTGG